MKCSRSGDNETGFKGNKRQTLYNYRRIDLNDVDKKGQKLSLSFMDKIIVYG